MITHRKLLLIATAIIATVYVDIANAATRRIPKRYNSTYTGTHTSRIAFPIGGIGTGMFCIEGSGAVSNMNIRYRNEMMHEPTMFATLRVAGDDGGCMVIEGQVPDWKKFGQPQSTKGYGGSWGFPRFQTCTFESRFPFAELQLTDDLLHIDVEIKAWNPFIPTDEDNSSLPVGGIEYTFHNRYNHDIDLIFAYNSQNFNSVNRGFATFAPMNNGFVVHQDPLEGQPFHQSDFAIFTDEDATEVNYCWFRGAGFDPLTMCWNDLQNGTIRTNAPEAFAPGASLYVPFSLKAGESRTIRLYMAWYVPVSPVREGAEPNNDNDYPDAPSTDEFGNPSTYIDTSLTAASRHRPWYASRFASIGEVAAYWLGNYDELKYKTELFTDSFYAMTLPDEVVEAVAANLTILKSPTVWRQYDGRMWNWEGCGNDFGSCYGSCTHVWNYAQATAHLFPKLERSLRETEFFVSQAKDGRQAFRSALPIRPIRHDFHAAADGQLGGMMKVYRDWRIYGNDDWLRMVYPYCVKSLEYCITQWDTERKGCIEEPHHNTYDIEFWGANGMINSYYAGALEAICAMGSYLGQSVGGYEELLDKCKRYTEQNLYNGEYFIQNIRWHGLKAADPTKVQSAYSNYSPEGLDLLEKEGPKYQYGNGCLSDGVVGSWLTRVCGLNEVLDDEMLHSHLVSVHRYNLRHSLRKHANPQRSTFAMGNDGGLLLCSWPEGGKLNLPFRYSDEVWTGIEYQVASHLIFHGEVEKGLEIVRVCRDRYDGQVRNPFNEYECGAWYARALSSYALIEALTGVRYDAVDKTLYIAPQLKGDFTSFLSTATGFGNVRVKRGKPFIEVVYGTIDVEHCLLDGKETSINIIKR